MDERLARLPCWVGDVEARPLSGGLSNEIWWVRDRRGEHVVRLGADYPFHHVERAHEAMVAQAAARAGFGPEVEYIEPGIMVTAFIKARTWTAADVVSKPVHIAELLRDFHQKMRREVSGPGSCFWVFHVIRDYAQTLKLAGAPDVQELAEWLDLARSLEDQQVPLPIVFGHHDLLPANILDDGSRLWLIDFEYAGFGTAMFDLAGVASNAGMGQAAEDELIGAYFDRVPDAELRRAFDGMKCASLLREAMWAMVSNVYLSATGVDYPTYAAENLSRLTQSLELFQTKYGRLS